MNSPSKAINQLTLLCPYCGGFSKKVTGEVVYPHRKDLWELKFYLCSPCDAYVGTHKSTDKPLGRLADMRLRTAKKAAHAAFDPMWRNGPMTRTEAYKWLAEKLGIDGKDCHIGMFDMDMCNLVIKYCQEEN